MNKTIFINSSPNKNVNTIVIGTPIYWYTVGGLLKTFIDRLYLLPKAEGWINNVIKFWERNMK